MIEELRNATDEDMRRLNALREFLRVQHVEEFPDAPAPTISIYCYRDVWGGIRISEIGYSVRTERGSGGASWMAGDLDSFPVIFAAERYLMDCLSEVEDHGDGAVLDLEQEARRGLLYWLMESRDYNALPDWEERNSNPLAVTA